MECVAAFLTFLLICVNSTVVAKAVGDVHENETINQAKADGFFPHSISEVEIRKGEDLERALVEQNANRQLLQQCQGPTSNIYYFEVYLRLVPSTDQTGVCTIADQFLMGNDLNQLLLDYGIGDAGADDELVFLAGVCPKPSTVQRRKLVSMMNKGFVWTGGGGCRYCLNDNKDRIRLRRSLNDWFTNYFAPSTTATLEGAIASRVVPLHTNCLGLTPSINVDLVQVSVNDLNLRCDNGRVIESLETLSLGDIPLMKHTCQTCVALDFSTFDDGSKINKGTWIKSQFESQHGLTITSSGGYSPNLQARIFDTGDVECVNVDGSRDFGSPNVNCIGVGLGGLGVGDGGMQDTLGENCNPIGNVLVVQGSNKTCPDSSSLGGTITFAWNQPVMLSSIGLMDVDEDDQRIRIKYADGFIESFSYSGFGDNAVQRVVAGKMHVVEVQVIFPGTGAITEISFCPECQQVATHDEDHHCLYTEDETTIESQEIVYFENFEDPDACRNWFNGRANDASPSLTSYLGKYGMGDQSPYKTFGISTGVAGVIIDLDFYEIDDWTGADGAAIYVSGEAIDMGVFHKETNEASRGGTTPLGVVWTVRLIDQATESQNSTLPLAGPSIGQRHHVKITVPQSAGLYRDGGLRLLLEAELDRTSSFESAGWDNIKVTTIHSCNDLNAQPNPTPSPSGSDVELTILSFSTGYCVEIPRSSLTEGARTVQRPCTGKDNQRFSFQMIQEGVYRIKAKHSHLCLSVDNGWIQSQINIVQLQCLDEPHQLWTIAGSGNNQRLKVTHTNMCLSVKSNSMTVGADLVQSDCIPVSSSVVWEMSDYLVTTGPMPPPASGEQAVAAVTISSAEFSSLCVDIGSQRLDDGAPVVQWTCTENPNQLFTFQHVLDGFFQIIASHSTKCIGVESASLTMGAKLIQQTCLGDSLSQHQLWFVSGSEGKQQLRAKHSNMCFNNGGISSLHNLFQWECGDGKNDLFRISDAAKLNPLLAPPSMAVLPPGAEEPELTVELPIISFLTGYCVDIPFSSATQRTTSVQWPCMTGKYNQQFLFKLVRDGVYRVKAKHSRLCLSVKNGSIDNGAYVVQQKCFDEPHQLWTISGKGNNQRLKVTHTNMCLSVNLGSTEAGTELVQTDCTPASNSQVWKVSDALVTTGPMPALPTGDPAQVAVAISSEEYYWLCVEIANAQINDGAIVLRQACLEKPNQLFTFEHVSEGFYRVIAQHSEKCLSVEFASQSKGARVIQQTCLDSSLGYHQQWFVSGSQGRQQLRARHSNMCLFGRALKQWTCNWGSDGFFRLSGVLESDSSLETSSSPTELKKAVGSVDLSIVSMLTGYCADVPFSKATITRVVQWPCITGKSNQRFVFELLQNGFYRVRAKHSYLCLGVNKGSTKAAANVVQQECLDRPHQLWTVAGRGNNQRLRVTHTNMCLSIKSNSTTAGAELVQMDCTSASNGSVWEISDTLITTGPAPFPANATPEQVAVTISLTDFPMLCLSVRGGKTADGDSIIIWDCFERLNQVFTFEHTGDGFYRIIAMHSRKCLAVELSSLSMGAKVIQQTCLDASTNDHQQWFLSGSVGQQQLRAKHSDMCLNNGGSLTLLSAFKQWKCGDGKNDIFQLSGVIKPAMLDKTSEVDLAVNSVELSILSFATGFCVDIPFSSAIEGTKAVQWPCITDKDNQRFLFEAVKEGVYRVRAKHSYLCLGVDAGSIDIATNVVQQNCLDKPHQLWTISGSGNNQRLKVTHSNMCLSVKLGLKAAGAELVQMVCTSRSDSEVWEISDTLVTTGPTPPPAIGGPSKIAATISSAMFYWLCIEIDNASLSNGALGVQADCRETPNQVFTFEHVHDGFYRIIAMHSKNCLAVEFASLSKGARVIQQTCLPAGSSNHQQWFVSDSEGKQQLKAKHSNLCLNNSGSSNLRNRLKQWDCGSDGNDLFRILGVHKSKSFLALTNPTLAPVANVNSVELSIFSFLSGYCVDIPLSSVSEGTKIVQWPCIPQKRNQRFLFETVKAGVYRIKARHSQLCLGVERESRKKDATVVQQSCQDQPHQLWTISGKGNNQLLRVTHTNLCLSVKSNSTVAGAELVQSDCASGSNSEVWKISDSLVTTGPNPVPVIGGPADAAGVTIRSEEFYWLCLDFANNLFQDGIRAVQGQCIEKQSQVFTFEHVSDRFFRIVTSHSMKCLGVERASLFMGARVVQETCSLGRHQQWFVSGSEGMQQLRARHSNLCINNGGSSSLGSRLQQVTCGDGRNDLFNIS